MSNKNAHDSVFLSANHDSPMNRSKDREEPEFKKDEPTEEELTLEEEYHDYQRRYKNMEHERKLFAEEAQA